ncbi:hypothetical protein PV377_41045 [Streptomyces ipomoeae]|uniref:hypothetical protein n=1 Tax=Streptomyces ipomoeae TaxID=103232 RepID=UPI0029A0097D|nr:hypothetical protein [Streptomyces ipomoeae]MDX2845233.1 hypothetical protein [Streptomyces ipomoeae]
MTCDRCHERIKPSEDYDTYSPASGSGAAPTAYLHKRPCTPVLRQTAPESSPIHRRR